MNERHRNSRTFPLALARTALAAVLATTAASAQELLGVDGQGNVVAIHMPNAAARLVHASTMGPCQAFSRKVNSLFSPNGTSFFAAADDGLTPRLFAVDPITGAATLAIANLGMRIVALADQPSTPRMWGIADGPTDLLVRIDVVQGSVTVVGSTGLTDVQGIELLHGQLYGWDATLGLVRIDSTTGAGSDVNPLLGAQGQDVRFLTIGAVDQIVGGSNELFAIDLATGALQPLGIVGMADVRGAGLRYGITTFFGTACRTATSTTSLLFLQGPLVVDTTAHFLSQAHPPGSPAALALALPSATHEGTPLPILLDPLLGTNGCSLLVSPLVYVPGFAASTGRVDIPVFLHGLAGIDLHAQLFTLENVPGGLVASDARSVRIPR